MDIMQALVIKDASAEYVVRLEEAAAAALRRCDTWIGDSVQFYSSLRNWEVQIQNRTAWPSSNMQKKRLSTRSSR